MNTKKKKQNNQQNHKDVVAKESEQIKSDSLLELTPEVLENIPLSERKKIQQIMVSKTHVGPLPSSEDLQEYDRTCPGAANRIIAMAEKEQNHRIDATKRRDSSEYTLASRGQIFALISLVLILLFCVFLAFIGSTGGAVTVACTLVVSIVAVFITGQKSSSRNTKNQPQDKTDTK